MDMTPIDKKKVMFSFGVFTDAQYANKKSRGNRFFRKSLKKLKKCINTFNSHTLDFIVNLGDLIDGGEDNYPAILEICTRFKAPLFHILGNHDYNIADHLKTQITKLFSIEQRYSSFMIQNWKIILLDGNEISFYAYPKDSKEYISSSKYYNIHNLTKPDWDGGMGEKQLKWLEGELRSSTFNQEKVMIFSHFPIYPDSQHTLWNANEVFNLIDKYSCVKAYFAGHNHNGEYAKTDKTHFLIFKGMVDSRRNTFAIVKVYSDNITIEGFGREENKFLPFSGYA